MSTVTTITPEMIERLAANIRSADEALNSNSVVTPSSGDPFLSFPLAIKTIVESGVLGATSYPTKALLDSNLTAAAANSYAVVTNDTLNGVATDHNGYYQKQGNAWVYLAWNPFNQFKNALQLAMIEANRYSEKVVESSDIKQRELIIQGPDTFTDKHGFVILELIKAAFLSYLPIKAPSLMTESFSVSDDGSKIDFCTDLFPISSIDGVNGFVSHLSKLSACDITLSSGYTGLIFEDIHGFCFTIDDIVNKIIEPAEDDSEIVLVNVEKPLFSRHLANWHDASTVIDVNHLLDDVSQQSLEKNVNATFTASSSSFNSTSDTQIFINDFKPLHNKNCWLMLRDKRDFVNRSRLVVKTIATPQGSNTPIKIHMIGDSITNRGGAIISRDYLVSHGYNPTFIGMMQGSGYEASSSDTSGELCEGREGWKTGDFTYQTTSRVTPLSAGDEEAYKNMSKVAKWNINPYIRPSRIDDQEKYIRNGYVFDFGYYIDRFSLDVPDVVYIGLGTNDANGLTPSNLSVVYPNLVIMIDKILEFNPNIKIVLGLPSTGFNNSRNDLFKDRYTIIIRALQTLESEYTNVVVAPIWATTGSQESSYSITNNIISTDPVSGADYGSLADSIHPLMATRWAIYEQVSAYMAACKLNLL